MHWDAIPAVASTISLALAPIAAVAWRLAHKRAQKRNAGGRCGACGLPWTEIGVAAHEHQVHGVRICAPCAHRLRRRTITEFAGLAVATAFTAGLTAWGFPKYLPWTPWWGMVWFASPSVLLAAATSFVIHRMKLLNRESTLRSGSGPAQLGPPGIGTFVEKHGRSHEPADADRDLLAQAT